MERNINGNNQEKNYYGFWERVRTEGGRNSMKRWLNSTVEPIII